jgi:hypothetical protein
METLCREVWSQESRDIIQTLEWSYPYVPIVSTIVEEREDSTNNRRIVLVFERDDDDA